MAARKKPAAPAAESDTGPGDIAVDESFAESGPDTPTGHIRVRGEEPVRAGGFVLTEKGWVRER